MSENAKKKKKFLRKNRLLWDFPSNQHDIRKWFKLCVCFFLPTFSRHISWRAVKFTYCTVQTRVCSLYNIFDKNNVLTKTEKTLYSNATFLLDHGRDFKIDCFILVSICYALLRKIFKRWTICKDIQLGTGRGAFFLHYFPLLDILLKVDVRCRPSNVNIFSRTTWSISNRFGM